MNNLNNVQLIQKSSGPDGDGDMGDWELEKALFYVHAQRLSYLDGVSQELELLMKGQEDVKNLHELIAMINAATDAEGKVKIEKDSDLAKLLDDAAAMSVKLKKTHGEFTDKEKGDVIESIRHFIEDLNTGNEMKMQQVTRITNERYEMYTMTRMCLKVLDEDKKNKARAIKGG